MFTPHPKRTRFVKGTLLTRQEMTTQTGINHSKAPLERQYYTKCHSVIIPLNPRATDDKTVAERKWAAGLKPAKPQQPCDIGLFSDDANQLDLCEMFMDPTND